MNLKQTFEGLCISLTQIYHGSLGAVTIAVRNIVSSSPNFASAGKLPLFFKSNTCLVFQPKLITFEAATLRRLFYILSIVYVL